MLRKGRKVVYLSLESRKNYENWGNCWSKEIGGNEISLISRERNKEEQNYYFVKYEGITQKGIIIRKKDQQRKLHLFQKYE